MTKEEARRHAHRIAHEILASETGDQDLGDYSIMLGEFDEQDAVEIEQQLKSIADEHLRKAQVREVPDFSKPPWCHCPGEVAPCVSDCHQSALCVERGGKRKPALEQLEGKVFEGKVIFADIDGRLHVVGDDHDTAIFGIPSGVMRRAGIEMGAQVRVTVWGTYDPLYDRVTVKDRVGLMVLKRASKGSEP